MDKQLSLLYGWHLLNVQQAKYLYSTMLVGTNIDCEVINALWPKAVIIWKFYNEINATIYSIANTWLRYASPTNQVWLGFN